MAKKPAVVEKKSNLELLDLRDNDYVIRLNGEIRIKKNIVWDNSNGQKGVMKNSFLELGLTGAKGKLRLVVGSKNQNIWVGKDVSEAKEAAAPEVLDI